MVTQKYFINDSLFFVCGKNVNVDTFLRNKDTNRKTGNLIINYAVLFGFDWCDQLNERSLYRTTSSPTFSWLPLPFHIRPLPFFIYFTDYCSTGGHKSEVTISLVTSPSKLQNDHIFLFVFWIVYGFSLLITAAWNRTIICALWEKNKQTNKKTSCRIPAPNNKHPRTHNDYTDQQIWLPGAYSDSS